MKKLIALLLASVMVLGVLAACEDTADDPADTTTTTAGPTTEPTEAETDLEGDLVVWSFTNELHIHAIAFQEANPNVDLDYVYIPTDDNQFQNRVIAAANTDECPDVIGLEAAFVKEFVESDMLLDLSDLMDLANYVGAYPNTIEVGTDYLTDEVRAYSYQTTPGAVFYRRSIANDLLGTDDPDEIQAMMEDMDAFTDLARKIKDDSDGSVVMVASVSEFRNAYFANRSDPWIVDNTLVIDPMIEDLFSVARTFRQESLDAEAQQWQEGWFNGMRDELNDPVTGEQLQIFTYFLPTWGLPYVLGQNAGDTAGDWGVVAGPLPYQWGGTWLGVMANASNPDLGKEFVKFVTMNEEHLKNWATGVFTNEYLQELNPEEAADMNQPAGDFVNSSKVVEELIPMFDDAEMSEFLGGQNFYAFWNEAAPDVSAELFQGTDQRIQDSLTEILERYASGEYDTFEEAMDLFKDQVASDLGVDV